MESGKTVRNHLRLILLAAAVLFIGSRKTECHAYAGATVFESLKINAGARPAGMGEAFAGLADDINAVDYNPAGLGIKGNGVISFTHNRWFQDITQRHIAYLDGRGFGIALNHLNYGKIGRTTISNTRGTGLGEFGSYDLALNAAYGRRYNGNLNFGFNVKYVRGKIDGYTGSGAGIGLGLLYSGPAEDLTVGLAADNMGLKVKFGEERESLPLVLKFGSAYRIAGGGLTALLDFSRESRNPATIINCGLEYRPNGFIALRAGLDTGNGAGSGLTAGFGINHRDFGFDYAYSPYGDLGTASRFTFTYKLK